MRDPDDTADGSPDADDDDVLAGYGGHGDEPSASSPASPPPRRARAALTALLWRPEPVARPEVDRELPRLPWPERCAESLRYAALRAERWVSPSGVLREWLRLNLWVGIAVLAFALLVVPPATLLLEGAAGWAGLIKVTALDVTATVAGLPPVVVALATGYLAAQLLRRGWLRRRAAARYYRERDEPYMG